MARKIIEVYKDDLTGETVQALTPTRFALDGVEYQIDLGPTSRAAFDAAVAPYRHAARRVGRASSGTRSATSRQPARTDPEQLRAIRAWWGRQPPSRRPATGQRPRTHPSRGDGGLPHRRRTRPADAATPRSKTQEVDACWPSETPVNAHARFAQHADQRRRQPSLRAGTAADKCAADLTSFRLCGEFCWCKGRRHYSAGSGWTKVPARI
jgi:Lsr2